MYTKMIPFKDYNQKPQNLRVQFQLEIPDVIKNIVELQFLFKWIELNGENSGPTRVLDNQDVKEFYTVFETILLNAWGELDDDGIHFRRGGRYDFEESKTWAATIVYFLNNPMEIGPLLESMLPTEMIDMVKNSEESTAQAIATETDPARKAELERLQAKIEELKNGAPVS